MRCLVEREARAVQRAPHVDAELDRRGGVGRPRGGEQAHHLGIAGRQARVPGRRHDRGERAHARREVDRHALRDHAAHRRADHVRALDPERVEQPDRVRRHVAQRIGRLHLVPGERLHDQRPGFGQTSSSLVDSPMSRLSKRMTR